MEYEAVYIEKIKQHMDDFFTIFIIANRSGQ